jgi:putative ABC transport system permease protein
MVTELFVPSMMNPDALKADGWSWFRIWIRPRADVDAAMVQTVLEAGFRADQVERAKQFPPETPKARIDAFFAGRLRLQPASSGRSAIQKFFQQPLWILATLAALLVLVACANVANLLLARATSRKIEMALRLSIGAARRRLIQLLLVESSLLAVLAAAVGALFSWWAAPFVVSMLTTPDRPIRLILDLDWRTLLTAATLTVAVTMLFGLAPAIRASATPLLDALKEVRGQRAHRRLANALIAAQTAFCVFLLFGASLFVGTLERLQSRPLGFAPDHVLQVIVEGGRQYTREEWAQLATSLRALPRVESVTVAGWAPLTGNRWRSTVTVPGRETPEAAPNWVSVTPGYIETMRMRLVEGRDFRAGERPPRRDEAGRPVPGVAIVNESFARAYFDGRSPIGQRVVVESSNAPMEIVGMTADAVYFSVREVNHPAVFIPFESRTGATILVRTEGPAADLLRELRSEVPRLLTGLQVHEALPFEALVTQQMIRERLLAALSTFFAAMGLVLAVVGIYGVLNYAVTREQREIGLRMALGARPGHVVNLLTARLAGMVILGAVAGIGAGISLTRVVRALLFQIESTDPSTLAAPLIALAAASVLAVLPPALRAVRTDPAQTIKTEG